MLKPSAVVELVWQDETGSTAMTTTYAPSSWTVSEIDTFAAAFVSILLPLTDSVLIKQRIKYISAPEAPGMASGSNPITHTGLFFFSTGPSTSDGAIAVPGVKDSVVLTSGPCADVCIDLGNSDVIALADAVIAAGMSNPFGDVFDALFAAYVQSRV